MYQKHWKVLRTLQNIEAVAWHVTRRAKDCLPNQLLSQIVNERNCWRKVLKKVVMAIQMIVEKNLSFRGSNENFGSQDNGNFLGMLKLIAQLDPLLDCKLWKCRFRQDFISVKVNIWRDVPFDGKKMLQSIIHDLQSSGYFGILVDSTPDITHIYQLSIILRYVEDDNLLNLSK